ncbi:hypothetical protein LVY75_35150 (plasmid) [Sinorhizobium sp. B11]
MTEVLRSITVPTERIEDCRKIVELRRAIASSLSAEEEAITFQHGGGEFTAVFTTPSVH